MTGKVRRSLMDALRSLAYRTTVDDLKRRGVRNVSVVGLDRMVGLVEEAVRRTLARSLSMGASGLAAGTLAANAREEFERLLEHTRELERAREEAESARKELEQEVDRLRLQLRESQGELEGQRQRIQQHAEAHALLKEHQLAEAVRTLFATADPALGALQEDVIRLVAEHVEEVRARALAAAMEERDEEVQRLRRRVGKLAETLEKAEHSLQRHYAGAPLEDGISSVFRSVQGLDRGDPQFETKSDALADIFLANRKLQKGQ